MQLKDPTQLHLFVEENVYKNVSEDSLETVPEAELATKTLKWNSNFGFVFLHAPYFQKNSNVESFLWLTFRLLH